MTQAQALAAIIAALGIPGASTPDDIQEAVAFRLGDDAAKAERGRKALARAAADMDAVSMALTQRRDRAGSSQAYADMTELAGKLVNNAADARNVLSQL